MFDRRFFAFSLIIDCAGYIRLDGCSGVFCGVASGRAFSHDGEQCAEVGCFFPSDENVRLKKFLFISRSQTLTGAGPLCWSELRYDGAFGGGARRRPTESLRDFRKSQKKFTVGFCDIQRLFVASVAVRLQKSVCRIAVIGR